MIAIFFICIHVIVFEIIFIETPNFPLAPIYHQDVYDLLRYCDNYSKFGDVFVLSYLC